MHLAHPLGIKGFENRRVKNDLADATMLADLLRMGRLPESWIPPHSIRELRELVRYRHKLSQLRTGLKGQVHAVLGKEGVIPHLTEMWGPAGHQFLDETSMSDAYQYRLDSLRDLIVVYDTEIRQLDNGFTISFVTMSGIERFNSSTGSGQSTAQPSLPRSATSVIQRRGGESGTPVEANARISSPNRHVERRSIDRDDLGDQAAQTSNLSVPPVIVTSSK